MTFINPRFFKPLKAFYQSAEARSRKLFVVEVELIQQFNIGQSAYDTEERDRLDRNPGRL